MPATLLTLGLWL